MTDPHSPLHEGVVVSDTYDVERRLGRGGMGEVWLARHRRLAGKQVAIKVLRTPVAQLPPDVAARFRREAEIAARLEHPNIVQVLDFNQLPSGEPYLVMEYLKGESLAARVAAGPLSLQAAQAVVRQVGAALQVAHAAGVVHRDLKPDNIFLVPTALGDQVKVLDFGISKLADGAAVQTTEQTLLGTPLYMSPEQALGHNKEVSAQSDLFSLGSVCYELLTGQAPFRAESVAQVVFRIAYEPPRALGELAPNVPAPVVAAVERALVKDKAQRTPDVATFVREFCGEALQATPLPSSVHPAESSGIATPGRPVSESLMMGATATPGSGGGVAAPAERTAPTSAQGGARASLIFVLVAAVAAGLFMVWRRSTRAEVPPAPPVEARVGAAPSSAHAAPTVAPEVPAQSGLDAAVELPSASAPVAPVAARPVPPRPSLLTEEEKSLLAELTGLASASQWDGVWSRRTAVSSAATTAAGKRALWLVVLEAACARSDVGQLNGVYNRLEALGDVAALRQARVVCRRHLPAWAPP